MTSSSGPAPAAHADASGSVGSGSAASGSVASDSVEGALSPALVDDSATRAAWLGLGAAVALPALHAVRALAREGADTGAAETVTRLVLLATVLAALALFVVRRYRVATPSTVLRAGLWLEVLVAFALGLDETVGPFAAGSAVTGVSAVGPWIVLAGASIPARPSWTLRAGLAAAAAWPLAYAVNVARGLAPAPGLVLLLWTVLNAALAVATYLAVRRRQAVGHEAGAQSDDVGGYTLVSRLGEGGMGEVWKATHKLLAREAAVKLIRPDVLAREGREADLAAARFRREARSIAQLQSPHTVFLYDFGISPDGRFYYVMELLDGIGLQTMIRDFGPIPAGRAVSILTQICRSLAEAHARGLVHRDLKPSNVMVCEVALVPDFVKVLDFGLAKDMSDPSATALTLAGAAAGTPGYIAPETALGEGDVDHRADIYGLGCVAYFLLTGTPVFEETDPLRAALLHVNQTPDPPSSRLGAPVPADLERLVLECLAKRPDGRPPTMGDVAERLARCQVEPWSAADAREWWEAHLAHGRADGPATPSSGDAPVQSARPRPATRS